MQYNDAAAFSNWKSHWNLHAWYIPATTVAGRYLKQLQISGTSTLSPTCTMRAGSTHSLNTSTLLSDERTQICLSHSSSHRWKLQLQQRPSYSGEDMYLNRPRYTRCGLASGKVLDCTTETTPYTVLQYAERTATL